jgi:hypothetical protein
VAAAQRARTTILAGNYGEAGAIERYGPADGLPHVYSGANNFWIWGPPPAADSAAIAVNVDPALLRRVFATFAASPRSGTTSVSPTTSRERRSISPPG